MGVGKYISSDIFFVGGHLWQIRFYPNGKNVDKNGGDVYVSFDIAMVSKSEEDVDACFEYVLLDQSGNKWHKEDTKFIIGPYMSGPFTLKDGTNQCVHQDLCLYIVNIDELLLETSQFIKDDCFTIQCTVSVVKTSLYVPKKFAQPPPLSDLRQSYEQLLESGEGSDVSFEVEGETFHAHKLILSTRSPVFKAQFFGPLREENTRCIKIEEMQAPIFMVRKFLYSLIVCSYLFIYLSLNNYDFLMQNCIFSLTNLTLNIFGP
ncbi:hypothetical protein RD792_002028 [Penstemon davidsonii]|uniref:Uncharacterized protein n=1 Tax=Penstemon davidsonii TaxID=160366 RepID=A0ABR0DPY1_9LAMI|nr:hypothetical protein RD792_002028 [Penstemon davidsonii]